MIFGTLFDLMIVQAISIIYLILQVQPRVLGASFFINQNGLYPMISRTSLIVFEALALAFSAPSPATFARYFLSARISLILVLIGSVTFIISSASCFFISPYPISQDACFSVN